MLYLQSVPSPKGKEPEAKKADGSGNKDDEDDEDDENPAAARECRVKTLQERTRPYKKVCERTAVAP